MGRSSKATVMIMLFALALAAGCATSPSEPDEGQEQPDPTIPRLALWLAKKDELIAHNTAAYDLVMSGWFDPSEATAIVDAHPPAKILAGLALTWVFNSPDWQTLLVTIANNGNPSGPLQITDDMYLMFDDNDDGILDTRCSPPGWEGQIYAMDPRHTGWRALILSFYDVVGSQTQHDGIIVDMLDAYPFCEGAWSEGVPVPLDEDGWVDGQEQLLSLVRDGLPDGKLLVANAGRDFPAGSPFPQYLDGYILENALGDGFGLETVSELLDSATRALTSTEPPHIVVYAVDTDDTGVTDWVRFRRGLVASLLTDHTYFAFDYGPRDHGGVDDWWSEQYYDIDLGEPKGPYEIAGGAYSREFDNGLVVASGDAPAMLFFQDEHVDIASGAEGTEFTVPELDARIFLKIEE